MGLTTTGRFPVLYAVITEHHPGVWETSREGVLLVGPAPDSPAAPLTGLLDVAVENIIASYLVAQAARPDPAGQDDEGVVLVCAVIWLPTGRTELAYRTIDGGETVEDAMRILDEALQRLNGGDSP